MSLPCPMYKEQNGKDVQEKDIEKDIYYGIPS
jgi:hypothetical protein